MPEWMTVATEFVQNVGFPIAVTGYLLWRDWKFMGAITALMGRMDAYLDAQGVPAPKKTA